MKPSEREYTGVTQFFHNYEHSFEGLTHCRGPVENPYRIVHYEGRHIINVEYAKGHGMRNIPQWFKFTERLGKGWLIVSGEKIESNEIPKEGKTKIYFNIDDKGLLRSGEDHDVIKEKLNNLEPISTRVLLR